MRGAPLKVYRLAKSTYTEKKSRIWIGEVYVVQSSYRIFITLDYGVILVQHVVYVRAEKSYWT